MTEFSKCLSIFDDFVKLFNVTMEVEFIKCHSMGTDYVSIDNRSGRYDAPLSDKEFCGKILSPNYGVGGVYINEIRRQTEDGRYEVRFINRQGEDGSYGGSNVATLSAAAKQLGLFKENCFPFTNGGRKYEVLYDPDTDRFSFNYDDFESEKIKEVDGGYFMELIYPHYIHMVDDVKSIDATTMGRKHQDHPALKHRAFSVTFFQKTDDEGTFLARTCSGTNRNEIPYCGSGSLAVAFITEWLKLKESNGASDSAAESKTKVVNVKYPGGSVEVSYAMGKDNFTKIRLGLQGTYVYKGQIPYMNDTRTKHTTHGTV